MDLADNSRKHKHSEASYSGRTMGRNKSKWLKVEDVEEPESVHRIVYLPPECMVKILEACDAKTVCRFSRCSRTAHSLVQGFIKRFAVPEFTVEIYNYRLNCLRNYTARRRIKCFEMLNDESTVDALRIPNASSLKDSSPFEVQRYGHSPECDDKSCQHKLLYRHVSSGIYIFPDIDPLPTVFNCRHKKLRLKISLCGLNSAELSAIHRVVVSSEPYEIAVDLYPTKHCKVPTVRRRAYPFHYVMTDAEPRLCLRFWSVFRERVKAINLQNTILDDWLTSYFLDFLAHGDVDSTWFAFPYIGTKEDEDIAFTIVRQIIERWPSLVNTPVSAVVTLPHYIEANAKPQAYIPSVKWSTSVNGSPCGTIKHEFYALVLQVRIFPNRLLLCIDDSDQNDYE